METKFDLDEKKRITREYLNLIKQYGLRKIYRKVDTKTFVSRYDFESTMRDLYKGDDGKFCVVWKFDPEPGGYGEEFILIEDMTEMIEVENAGSLTEDELLELVSKAKKISVSKS